MKTSEFFKEMAWRLDVDEKDVKKGYGEFMKLVRETLDKGRGIVLKDFINVYLYERKPKTFFNCKTRETGSVDAKLTYKARLSTSLRRKLEKGYMTKKEMAAAQMKRQGN